jgi:activating signal cointegrator 1
MTDVFKAVSLWQPWASLWLSPNKRHETRHWETKHRGRLLVHAAQKFVRDVDRELNGILSSEFGGHWGMELPTGALIGMVDLIDVIPTEQLYRGRCGDDLTDDDLTDMACGDFADCRFGWRRGTYWAFRERVPFKGHQRIFNVPSEIVASAMATAKEVCG